MTDRRGLREIHPRKTHKTRGKKTRLQSWTLWTLEAAARPPANGCCYECECGIADTYVYLRRLRLPSELAFDFRFGSFESFKFPKFPITYVHNIMCRCTYYACRVIFLSIDIILAERISIKLYNTSTEINILFRQQYNAHIRILKGDLLKF